MRLRIVGAVALIISAAVHLYLWFDGVRDQSVGPMFLTLGFGAATLGAFVIASTVGLLGVHTVWAGGSVWTAAIAEAVCIVVGGMLLLRERTPAPGMANQRSRHAA